MLSAWERENFIRHKVFLATLIREALQQIDETLSDLTGEQKRKYEEMKSELITILNDIEATAERTLGEHH